MSSARPGPGPPPDFDAALLRGAIADRCARRWMPLTGDPSYTLEDYVQDACLRAWQAARAGYRLSGVHLDRLVGMVLIDVLRARGRVSRSRRAATRPRVVAWSRAFPPLSDSDSDGSRVAREPVAAWPDPVLREELWDALALMARLPDQERTVLWAHAVADRPQEEIAARLGVCPSRVSQLVARARRWLREADAGVRDAGAGEGAGADGGEEVA